MALDLSSIQGEDQRYGNTSSISADTFTRVYGREPTESELKLVNDQWHSFGVQTHTDNVQAHHYGSQDEAVNAYRDLIGQASTYANQVATAMGYTLTPEQLDSMSSQYIDPTSLSGAQLKLQEVRDSALDKVKDFLGANVNRIGMENTRNPTVNDEQTGNVQRIFQEIYGREANADEAKYFGQELARGKSSYELSQELMSLPEYQRVQAQKDRASLDQELQTQQAEVFRRAQPQIISSFMRAGRLNSSGLNSALAQAQADLDRERQGSLAQIGAQDAATIRANAFQDFLRRDQPYQTGRELFSPAGAYQTNFGLVQQGLGRQRELGDYYRQQSDYNRYLSQQRSYGRENALYGLGGAVLGAGIQGLTAGLMK